jgi:hypothetical protein
MTNPDSADQGSAQPQPSPPSEPAWPVVPIVPDPALHQLIERNDKPDLTKEHRSR